jgi:hypothetical protein
LIVRLYASQGKPACGQNRLWLFRQTNRRIISESPEAISDLIKVIAEFFGEDLCHHQQHGIYKRQVTIEAGCDQER